MGNFNEIQKGMPDLGKTYWQDLKNQTDEDNPSIDIVKMNCETIFDTDKNIKKPKNKSSIFE